MQQQHNSTLKKYEIIVLIYFRKIAGEIYYDFAAQGYNNLSYSTLHHEVWSTNVFKYKPIWIGQPNQLIHFYYYKIYTDLSCKNAPKPRWYSILADQIVKLI